MIESDYHIIHDHGLTLCFVGRGAMSQMAYTELKDSRPSELVSVEDLDNKDTDWFSKRQFICISGDANFKQATVAKLESADAKFFSMVGKQNVGHTKIKIGVGTFIASFNDFLPYDCDIGNYCHITSYNQMSHGVTICDYAQLSGYNYLGFCRVGVGAQIGLRCSIIGVHWKNLFIDIPDYSAILSGSIVTKPIEVAGTYHSNRRISDETILDKRFI